MQQKGIPGLLIQRSSVIHPFHSPFNSAVLALLYFDSVVYMAINQQTQKEHLIQSKAFFISFLSQNAHECARLACGCTLSAVEAVVTNKVKQMFFVSHSHSVKAIKVLPCRQEILREFPFLKPVVLHEIVLVQVAAKIAPCKGIQEWNLDSGLSRIRDSLSCIPDSKAQESGFHKQNFPGFQNPHSLTWSTKRSKVSVFLSFWPFR